MLKELQCIPFYLKGSLRIIVAVACFEVDNFLKISSVYVWCIVFVMAI